MQEWRDQERLLIVSGLHLYLLDIRLWVGINYQRLPRQFHFIMALVSKPRQMLTLRTFCMVTMVSFIYVDISYSLINLH